MGTVKPSVSGTPIFAHQHVRLSTAPAPSLQRSSDHHLRTCRRRPSTTPHARERRAAEGAVCPGNGNLRPWAPLPQGFGGRVRRRPPVLADDSEAGDRGLRARP
jgi:hypothetical protein